MPTTAVKRRGPKGRVDNAGFLASVARLVREGATPEEVQESLDVSRATYYRAMTRIKQMKAEASMRRD